MLVQELDLACQFYFYVALNALVLVQGVSDLTPMQLYANQTLAMYVERGSCFACKLKNISTLH